MGFETIGMILVVTGIAQLKRTHVCFLSLENSHTLVATEEVDTNKLVFTKTITHLADSNEEEDTCEKDTTEDNEKDAMTSS